MEVPPHTHTFTHTHTHRRHAVWCRPTPSTRARSVSICPPPTKLMPCPSSLIPDHPVWLQLLQLEMQQQRQHRFPFPSSHVREEKAHLHHSSLAIRLLFLSLLKRTFAFSCNGRPFRLLLCTSGISGAIMK